jgi:5-methylcytosine-specific restriction endonuclease McrA
MPLRPPVVRWPRAPRVMPPGYVPRATTAERGYAGDWPKIRARHLAQFPDCTVCGDKANHVDHIASRARGGTDYEGNLQSLCHSCHSRKTAKYDGAWGRTPISAREAGADSREGGAR